MDNHQLTRLLNDAEGVLSPDQARDIEVVYQRLKKIARGQRFKIRGTGVNTTMLVNEAWIKSQNESRTFNDQQHFFAYCALAMRHILINEARRNRLVTYCGDSGDYEQAVFKESDYLLDLETHLKQLRAYDERLEQVFVYKFFGDMEFSDIGEVLGTSERTVFRDWKKARAMLAAAMQ